MTKKMRKKTGKRNLKKFKIKKIKLIKLKKFKRKKGRLKRFMNYSALVYYTIGALAFLFLLLIYGRQLKIF